jgi:hypothetical protein
VARELVRQAGDPGSRMRSIGGGRAVVGAEWVGTMSSRLDEVISRLFALGMEGIMRLTGRADSLMELCKVAACPLLREAEACEALLSKVMSDVRDLEREWLHLLALPVAVTLTIDPAYKKDAVSIGGAFAAELREAIGESLGTAGRLDVLFLEEGGCAVVMLLGDCVGISSRDLAEELVLQAGDAGSRLRSTLVGNYVHGGELQGRVSAEVWQKLYKTLASSELQRRQTVQKLVTASAYQHGISCFLIELCDCAISSARLCEEEVASTRKHVLLDSVALSRQQEVMEQTLLTASAQLAAIVQVVDVYWAPVTRARAGLSWVSTEIRTAESDGCALHEDLLVQVDCLNQLSHALERADQLSARAMGTMERLSRCIDAQVSSQQSRSGVLPASILTSDDFLELHDQLGSSKFKAWLQAVKGKRGRSRRARPILVEFLRMLAALDDAHDAELQYNDAMHTLLSTEAKILLVQLQHLPSHPPVQSADSFRNGLDTLSNTTVRKRIELSDAIASLYHSILYAESHCSGDSFAVRKNSPVSFRCAAQSPPPPPPRRDRV